MKFWIHRFPYVVHIYAHIYKQVERPRTNQSDWMIPPYNTILQFMFGSIPDREILKYRLILHMISRRTPKTCLISPVGKHSSGDLPIWGNLHIIQVNKVFDHYDIINLLYCVHLITYGATYSPLLLFHPWSSTWVPAQHGQAKAGASRAAKWWCPFSAINLMDQFHETFD